jgi:hypothetical protein
MTKDNKPWLREGWKPKCNQDMVDLLFEVQLGNISCRRAASILFPEFNSVNPRVDEEEDDD